MDADPAAPRATTSPDLWAACEERAVVRLTLACGQMLTGAYTKARTVRLRDPPHDAGHIQIEVPIKERTRFVAVANRDEHSRMAWRWVWDGNHTEAGLARHRRALRCDAYARMVEVLRHGRRGVQPDLFCRWD